MTAPFQPTFLVPSASGQLSNRRGANTGTDALSETIRYRHPTGVAAGMMRIVATKSFSGGQSVSYKSWDSGMLGTPSTNPWPGTGTVGPTPQLTVIYNGRVYVIDPTPSDAGGFVNPGTVWSAAANNSAGSWRNEGSVGPPSTHFGSGIQVSQFPTGSYAKSACVVNGRLYVLTGTVGASAGTITYASFNADGTIGSWVISPATTTACGVIVGWFGTNLVGSPQGVLVVLGHVKLNGDGTSNDVNTTQYVGLNTDGSLQGWTNGTVLPTALENHAVYIDQVNNFILVAGGLTGGVAQTAIYTIAIKAGATQGTVDVANFLTNSWNTQTHALPLLRQGGGVLVDRGIIFFIGGGNGPGNTSGQTTAWAASLATTVSTSQVGTWTAALTPALPAAQVYGAMWLSTVGTNANGSQPFVLLTGGIGSAGSILPTTQANISNVVSPPTAPTTWALNAWASGTNTLTVTGPITTIVTNTDLSQDVTFLYGSGGTVSSALVDGDIVSVAVFFTDSASGLQSPTGYTSIKIGQAPTLVSTSPANASTPAGAFTASFGFQAGAGGGLEQNWRIQEQQPSGTTIIDSGTVNGTANSFATRAGSALSNTPLPSNGQTGAVLFQATSQDSPMQMAAGTSSGSGSTTLTDSSQNWTVNLFAGAVVRAGTSFGIVASNTATVLTLTALGWQGGTPPAVGAYTISAATLALVLNTTTYTGTTPGAPTAVTAVADNVNGLVTVGWTSAASTATNRIWYRPSGTSAWLLAKDNVTSTGSAQTFQVMEPLALNQPYDFAVSGLSSAPVEGALSSAVTNVTIYPFGADVANHFEVGGYHAMLSIVGNGPNQHVPLWVTDGKVQIDRDIAAEVAMLFGATAPSARYGIYNYRTVNVKLTQRLADIAGMESILAAVLTGSTLCYRDIFNGIVLYCVLPAKRQDTEDQYLEKDLQLVETNFLFTP